jgi:hypothetical protein
MYNMIAFLECVDVCVYCWLQAALRMVLVGTVFSFFGSIASVGAMNGVYIVLFGVWTWRFKLVFGFCFRFYADRCSPLSGIGPDV